MKTFWNILLDFLGSQEGPTATEYAVMLALIVALCFAVLIAIGDKVSAAFSDLEGGLPSGEDS